METSAKARAHKLAFQRNTSIGKMFVEFIDSEINGVVK